MNFAWSLRPIFIWLTICTGLDFDRSTKRSNIGRWLLRVYSLVWLVFFTIPINTLNIVYEIFHFNSNKIQLPLTMSLNRTLSWNLVYSLVIVLHLSVIVSALIKWKPLWKKIKLIQSDLSDLTTSYRRLRHETFLGLLLLSTVISSHFLK